MDWALIVATYNRPEILATCISLATEQTCPPTQIVIVDASPEPSASKRQVTQIVDQVPGIELIWAPALERSLASQRNQGLALAEAEIVFFFDDDSLMYPDCAAEIMRVYEADRRHLLLGVQAGLAPSPPGGLELDEPTKDVGSAFGAEPWRAGALQRWVLRHVLFWDGDSAFIPYTGTYPEWSLPPEVAALDVVTTRLFHGCRMTFRRDAIAAEGFEGSLRAWSADEDMDASYRVSRHGAIATSKRARLCHYQSAGARLNRRVVTTTKLTNQAFFLRKHATGPGPRRRYYARFSRRLLAELLKDLAGRRWSLPQVRGVLDSIRISRGIFTVEAHQLDAWYVRAQERLLAR